MYGGVAYAGGSFAGSDAAEITAHDEPILAVEWSPTTDALTEDPVWVDISHDVRSWDVRRGRRRELERHQPGRATILLGNRDAQYDSQNASGPFFGNIRPERRIRIRETFREATHPIFDGFIDGWTLDYPGLNHDATATVIATDGSKLFRRTDLPLSAYHAAVEDDSPTAWWRLDESKNFATDNALTALNYGTSGTTDDGTYVGPPELGKEPLIVKDPGSSIDTWGSQEREGAGQIGVSTPMDLFSTSQSWALEAWCIPKHNTSTNDTLLHLATGNTAAFVDFIESVAGSEWSFRFLVSDSGGFFDLTTKPVSAEPQAKRYHVVAKFTPGGTMRLWVDGAEATAQDVSSLGPFDSGGTLKIGFNVNDTDNDLNWFGAISQVAVYLGADADAVDQAWVDNHHDLATAPWQGDLPGARADRVLDLTDWPDNLRQLDNGSETLQSAALDTSVLEHLQKIGESEFGAVFVTRDGNVRLISRANLFAGTSQATFGDSAGEIGYRFVEFDDGDTVIRNRATISRFNGVAKTSTDTASVTEFGRFQYTLEGLLHDSDSHSASYAQFIVDEYGEPRRRVVRLELGPAIVGEEGELYPQMFARELAELVTVKLTPLGGSAFSQVCRIEGIAHSGAPGGRRTTTWMLSPDFTNAVF